jgi:hypothetical protein
MVLRRSCGELWTKSFHLLGAMVREVVQVVIEDAEPLYREIRIQNHFHDANGNALILQVNSEVEITIQVRTGK